MRILNVDEFMTLAATPALGIETLEDCLAQLDKQASTLVTCAECRYSFRFHRSTFCKLHRRSSEPLIDMLVEPTDFCSDGRLTL